MIAVGLYADSKGMISAFLCGSAIRLCRAWLVPLSDGPYHSLESNQEELLRNLAYSLYQDERFSKGRIPTDLHNMHPQQQDLFQQQLHQLVLRDHPFYHQ